MSTTPTPRNGAWWKPASVILGLVVTAVGGWWTGVQSRFEQHQSAIAEIKAEVHQRGGQIDRIEERVDKAGKQIDRIESAVLRALKEKQQ